MSAPGTNLQTPTVGLTSTLLLGSSPHRRCLTFSAPISNRVTISFGAPAVLDAGLLTLFPGQRPVTVYKDEIGELITDAVFGIAAVGAQAISVTEAIDYP